MQKVMSQKKKPMDRQMLEAEYNKSIEILNNIPQFLEGYGVDRARIMLKALGNPEKQLKVIHVAGTNGKGSVCAYLERILRENGYKVGLFTSPHLTDIRERIKIDGELISREEFLWGFDTVKEAVEECGLQPAYFDYLLGIAVLSFIKENVDYCIMETGLGGKLDATNAIENKLLNVITGVSLEHTAILGNTVEQIAEEKAGIVKAATPVVYMDKLPAVAEVIVKRACSEKSDCVEAGYKNLRIIKNTGKSIDFSVHNR
ncbi:MAG: bifunctional folylpolyglutamate synthase/dihydrofolate synthase, partial [Lachnospira sp.]|nr:bifunctional folylpolyglutamate synthase/dihydrofolate synthase [Lachnospira sp.]